jgi:hypothetical protein
MSIALEPRRPLLLNLITEHNPFYLLSAACMLAGCLALGAAVSLSKRSEHESASDPGP